METQLSGGERLAKVEMIFLLQWRVGVGRSGEGGRRQWCGFKLRFRLERGGD
jgi:hypothetical protein